jgi:hypothetical protein
MTDETEPRLAAWLPAGRLDDLPVQDYQTSLYPLLVWLSNVRADVFGGMLWERGYLAIAFTDAIERHVGEARARFAYPERVYGFPAQYTLLALEECQERLLNDREAATMDCLSVDVLRSRVIVETKGDIPALQRRLRRRLWADDRGGPRVRAVAADVGRRARSRPRTALYRSGDSGACIVGSTEGPRALSGLHARRRLPPAFERVAFRAAVLRAGGSGSSCSPKAAVDSATSPRLARDRVDDERQQAARAFGFVEQRDNGTAVLQRAGVCAHTRRRHPGAYRLALEPPMDKERLLAHLELQARTLAAQAALAQLDDSKTDVLLREVRLQLVVIDETLASLGV